MITSLIITLIVAGLVYWLITLLPLPSPFPEIIKVIVILVLIVWILQLFGVLGGKLL